VECGPLAEPRATCSRARAGRAFFRWDRSFGLWGTQRDPTANTGAEPGAEGTSGTGYGFHPLSKRPITNSLRLCVYRPGRVGVACSARLHNLGQAHIFSNFQIWASPHKSPVPGASPKERVPALSQSDSRTHHSWSDFRRGQAICRLAQLARFLIRSNAGRGERGRASGRFAVALRSSLWAAAVSTPIQCAVSTASRLHRVSRVLQRGLTR